MKRGFLLITVMLLTLVLFTMGLAFLGSRASQYTSSNQAVLALQARALAQSGVEDARIKFERDPDFPPLLGPTQTSLNYSEDVLDGTTPLGSYRVVVDFTDQAPPYYTVAITSTGCVGPRAAPLAQHTYTAYLNVNSSSTRCYQFIRWDDQGGL